MNKKRLSFHNGKKSQKTGKIIMPPHNDTNRQKNENVKSEWVERNYYYNCYDGEYTSATEEGKMRFQEAELKYYETKFSAALEVQNDKHILARQKNRVMEMKDWLKSPRYAPSETILRVGNVDDGFADPKSLKSITDEYIELLNNWSAEHNNCIYILDYALHADEYYTDEDTNLEKMSSPHVHLRYVWQYVDDNGNLTVGQEKALEHAGVELPNPAKKPGRYNNRMMTFTAEFRSKLQEIVKEHGFDIEIEPLPTKRKAKDKQTYVAEKRAKKEAEKALDMQRSAEEAHRFATNLQTEAIRLNNEAQQQKRQNEIDAEQNENNRIENENRALQLKEKEEKIERQREEIEEIREKQLKIVAELENNLRESRKMLSFLNDCSEKYNEIADHIKDESTKQFILNYNAKNTNRFTNNELLKSIVSIQKNIDIVKSGDLDFKK